MSCKKIGVKKAKNWCKKIWCKKAKNWCKKIWCKKAKNWCKKIGGKSKYFGVKRETHVKIWLFSIFRGRTPKSKVTLSEEWIENVMTGISGVIELRNYTNFHSERWVINSG
mgnify:CR=1 FL=1